MGIKSSDLWKLFVVFFKISPVTFGGGYAMISLIEREVVSKHKWIKRDDMLDIFTIAQTVPGAVAINSAIFIGYRVSGVAGSIFALAGIILPTLIIVICISFIYYAFRDNAIVGAAFNGIGAAVIALIIHAGYMVARKAIFDVATLFIAVLCIAILLVFKVNPVWVIVGGFAVGMLISKVRAKKDTNNEQQINVKEGLG